MRTTRTDEQASEDEKALASCGWTAVNYLRMNPDLGGFERETLPTHFVVHGLREKRKYTEVPEMAYRIETVAYSGGDLVVYGWGEKETDNVKVLVVSEEAGKAEWELVEATALWYWRDDVADHLGVPMRSAMHGMVLVAQTKMKISNPRVYVFAQGRFVEYDGRFQSHISTAHAMLECFRMLEKRHVYEELVYLVQRYPAFLELVGEIHEREMAAVPALPIYEHVGDAPQYSICAVTLGNPQMLKTWLMALPDLHDLRKCEVNVYCNGPDEIQNMVRAARWFGEVLGGNIRVFHSSRNVGFNHAVNRLVRNATAPFVMVTNIDVKYLAFDFDRLSRRCSDGKTICAARQFNAMGALQHLSLEIGVQKKVLHGELATIVESRLIGRNTFLENGAADDVAVEYFGAACFFGPREFIAALGPFSPKYLYAYHEDSDFALRARRAGAKLVVSSALDLVHYESSAAQGDLPKTFFVAANSVRFLQTMEGGVTATPVQAVAGTVERVAALAGGAQA
jgi:GT2 family glycosyltransferase